MKSVLLLATVWVTGAGLQESATVGLKMIAVTTESEAVGLRARLDAGEFFDELARSYSVDASGVDGGYVGQVQVADLREEFRSAVTDLPPGEVSAVTRIGVDFVLLTVMTDLESQWLARLEAGLRAKGAGNYGAAESALASAVADAEVFGRRHPHLARSLHNLGLLHQEVGNYAAAEPLYRRALAIWEQALGPEHPNVGLSLGNLASLHRAQGEYDRAEPLYLRALEIAEASLGAGHPDVVGGRNNLALFYDEQAASARVRGDLAETERLYRQALDLREQAFGSEHLEIVPGLEKLSELLRTRGNDGEADRLDARARRLREASGGR